MCPGFFYLDIARFSSKKKKKNLGVLTKQKKNLKIHLPNPHHLKGARFGCVVSVSVCTVCVRAGAREMAL